jgi:hypothetical protein
MTIEINDTTNTQKQSVNNFPWVFWIHIKRRPQWFSYWWKTRGANYIEFQVWIFRISIGMPWLKYVLEGQLRDYKTLRFAKETNDGNQKMKFSFLIGKYKQAA